MGQELILDMTSIFSPKIALGCWRGQSLIIDKQVTTPVLAQIELLPRTIAVPKNRGGLRRSQARETPGGHRPRATGMGSGKKGKS
jgi:hypothetical protein